MISNVKSVATSVRSRENSLKKRKDLLKSDILSKEEEARLIREKREKMEAIKKQYSRRSR